MKHPRKRRGHSQKARAKLKMARQESFEKAMEDVISSPKEEIKSNCVEYNNGTKAWYQHGRFHRLDGPAVEWPNGCKDWYYKGKRISCSSQEEFERIIRLKAFW
jgi:hypothetical protein